MQEKKKYIFKVMNDFFSGRYNTEVEKNVQKWILDDNFREEKEDTLFSIWEKISVKADQSTYKSLNTVLSKLGLGKVRYAVNFRRRLLRIAAVLIPFLFLVTGGYYILRDRSAMIEFSVPNGQLAEKTLTDGTNVWINSGSTISHKENVQTDSERRLALTGEAAFSVEKYKKKPFIIETKHLNVTVLGTELNVKAYPMESKTIVTLVSGSVRIESEKNEIYNLEPGQQLIYNNTTGAVSIENVNVSDFLNWRTGQALFDDATFEEMIAGIQRYHGTAIDVDETLYSNQNLYTLRFLNNESIVQTMSILHKLVGGFGYDIHEDNTVYIYNPNSNPAAPENPSPAVSSTENSATKITDTVSKLTIRSEEISYRDIFNQIESQTGYTIGYNQTQFDAYRVISISQEEASLEDIMAHILKNSGFTYILERKFILIKEDELHGINGYILDSKSGSPIANAHIVLNNDRSLGARTNSVGYFSIGSLNPENYSARIDANGYLPEFTHILLSGEKSVSIRIEMKDAVSEIEPLKGSASTEQEESIVSSISTMNRPHLVLKSNVLYLAATTPNIALEFSLNNKWTVDVVAGYNPFTFGDKKLQHFLIQPELRFWPRLAFNRHFIGLHLHYGKYDIAGFGTEHMISNKYSGYLAGGGISYGYNYKINNNWAIEGTIGVGYARMKYDHNTGNGLGLYNYIGPTKLGISLIYKIK